MSRALVTFGVDSHAELLDLALPSFRAFADAYGYELEQADFDITPRPNRPASWWKVPVLLAALDRHDEALWLDADLVIVDASNDLDVPADAWQANARHLTQDGLVPNCGLWLVRQPMRPMLERLWGMTHHIHSPWWEQSALCEILGYDAGSRPLRLIAESPLYKHTHWLEPEWNRHCRDTQPVARSRVMHATMMPDQPATMREWETIRLRDLDATRRAAPATHDG